MSNIGVTVQEIPDSGGKCRGGQTDDDRKRKQNDDDDDGARHVSTVLA